MEISMDLNEFKEFTNGKITDGQLKQDLLALYLFGSDGYFVEFGATDGKGLSNTFLLEKDYGWNGILCEPSKIYHNELIKNRDCIKDFRCVSNTSGEFIDFAECDVPELSSMLNHIDSDHWYEKRKNNRIYQVETVTLDDLLLSHNAPKKIEYISIDTEGSELIILEAFSFNWDIKLFTIEHNYAKNRENISFLMANNGYKKIFPEISEWDDWYFRE
jgi:hypothetical protein